MASKRLYKEASLGRWRLLRAGGHFRISLFAEDAGCWRLQIPAIAHERLGSLSYSPSFQDARRFSGWKRSCELRPFWATYPDPAVATQVFTDTRRLFGRSAALEERERLIVQPAEEKLLQSSQGEKSESVEPTACTGPQAEDRHLVKDVVAVLRTVKRKADMQEKLAPYVGRLSARDVTVVFKMMYNRQVAVLFYKWVKTQPGFEPHLHLYMAFAHCLMRVQKWVALERLVDEMSEKKFPPNARLSALVIRAASNAGRLQTVDKWFNKMESHGCPFDLVIYNLLITAYGKEAQFDQAFSYFRRLKEEGFVPDGATYCAILSACRKVGNIEMAVKLFKQMQESGTPPDQLAFSIMIDIYGKVGKHEDASRTFQEMQVKANILGLEGPGYLPDPVAFNTLKQFGFKANENGYGSILKAFVRAGLPAKAIQVFQVMQNSGCPVGESTYITMLNVYSKAGMHSTAENLLTTMSARGFRLNVVTYSTLIDMYGKVGKVQEAMRVFSSMKQQGCPGNLIVYNSMLDMYGKAGRLRDAERLLVEMKKSKLHPDTVTYTILINAYNQVGQYEESIRVYEQHMADGLKLDRVIVAVMVNVFGKARQYSQLAKVLEEMPKSGIQPDARILKTVVEFYEDGGLCDSASDLLQRIQELGRLQTDMLQRRSQWSPTAS